jgi:hypothetical protein
LLGTFWLFGDIDHLERGKAPLLQEFLKAGMHLRAKGAAGGDK